MSKPPIKRFFKRASGLLFFMLGLFAFLSRGWSKSSHGSEDFLKNVGLDTAHADYVSPSDSTGTSDPGPSDPSPK